MIKLISLGTHIILVDTGRKPSIEEIKKQLIENAQKYEPFDDELAFEKHLIRKWSKCDLE